MEALREELKFRRDFMLQLLAEHFSDVAVWQVPKGGFYIWLKIRAAISTRKLFYLALREGILLNPGHVYDEHDERHLRLSYSYPSKEQLEGELVRLRNLLKTFEKQKYIKNYYKKGV